MTAQAVGTKGKILVVDDEPIVVKTHAFVLREAGYDVMEQTSSEKVLGDLAANPDIDLVLLDIRMPGIDGMALLRQIKSLHPRVGVMMVSVIPDVEQVVWAMKMGAYSYLEKPVSPDHFERELSGYFSANPRMLANDVRFSSFVTRSNVMEEIFLDIKSLAEKSVPVLIEGESGTGKELVAHLLHSLSPRAPERFVPLNVSAIPRELFESELFGYREGSFTGATRDYAGCLENTGNGTLFLDEIGDLDLEHQKKLLRAIETSYYRRVGETEERQFHGRFVMATNHDLRQNVLGKRFRGDLYYRLEAHRIILPPLRDRPEDIEPLANHFLRKYCTMHNVPLKELAPETMRFLKQYPFPGNVRELEGMINNAVITEKDLVISLSSLRNRVPPPLGNAECDLKQAKRRLIADALQACEGNKTQAAKKLGISRNALKDFLKKNSEGSGNS